jgi:hypothetical protein
VVVQHPASLAKRAHCPQPLRQPARHAEITDGFIAAVVPTGIAALRSTAPGTD